MIKIIGHDSQRLVKTDSLLVVGQRVAVDAVMFADEYYAALVVACPDSVDTLSGELEAIELGSLPDCVGKSTSFSSFIL